MRSLQSYISAFCVLLLLAPGVRADDTPKTTTPASDGHWYERLTRRYKVVDIEPINLANSPRLE
jgi:hypothetical protein